MFPIDLPQVDLMNFRVEYVRPRGGLCFFVPKRPRLNKPDEGLFRKSNVPDSMNSAGLVSGESPPLNFSLRQKPWKRSYAPVRTIYLLLPIDGPVQICTGCCLESEKYFSRHVCFRFQILLDFITIVRCKRFQSLSEFN